MSGSRGRERSNIYARQIVSTIFHTKFHVSNEHLHNAFPNFANFVCKREKYGKVNLMHVRPFSDLENGEFDRTEEICEGSNQE